VRNLAFFIGHERNLPIDAGDFEAVPGKRKQFYGNAT
jgi:hypothetical protein